MTDQQKAQHEVQNLLKSAVDFLQGLSVLYSEANEESHQHWQSFTLQTTTIEDFTKNHHDKIKKQIEAQKKNIQGYAEYTSTTDLNIMAYWLKEIYEGYEKHEIPLEESGELQMLKKFGLWPKDIMSRCFQILFRHTNDGLLLFLEKCDNKYPKMYITLGACQELRKYKDQFEKLTNSWENLDKNGLFMECKTLDEKINSVFKKVYEDPIFWKYTRIKKIQRGEQAASEEEIQELYREVSNNMPIIIDHETELYALASDVYNLLKKIQNMEEEFKQYSLYQKRLEQLQQTESQQRHFILLKEERLFKRTVEQWNTMQKISEQTQREESLLEAIQNLWNDTEERIIEISFNEESDREQIKKQFSNEQNQLPWFVYYTEKERVTWEAKKRAMSVVTEGTPLREQTSDFDFDFDQTELGILMNSKDSVPQEKFLSALRSFGSIENREGSNRLFTFYDVGGTKRFAFFHEIHGRDDTITSRDWRWQRIEIALKEAGYLES